MTISKITASVALVSALALQACIVVDSDDSTFTLDNQSDYAIYQAFLAERGAPDWGGDLLAGEPLLPGDLIEVFDLRCGTYDAQVYSELGEVCELYDIDICFDDGYWVIDNALLSTCPVFQ